MTRYEKIYSVVKQIPAGKIATYGQIAKLAGLGGQARQVGYALNSLAEENDVPWHRVINSRGEISKRGNPVWEDFQRSLLESEGIVFDLKNRVDLSVFQWESDDY